MERQMFGRFYLDKEKDVIVDLAREGEELFYTLRTPHHRTGNLITNLARLCDLPLTFDAQGLKVIEGPVPCYIDGQNHPVYVFRLGGTKVANIYPDGTVDRKASIPAISKTLMSQTKDYHLDLAKTLVKTYIRRDCKFRTDLHTHMNANLDPDTLIALGISHQIRYPLYYIKKLGLALTKKQEEALAGQRAAVEAAFVNEKLTGKHRARRIDDNTFINFASLILENLENAAENIEKIRASLTILKDGQAVFTNLEKVYLYRYVFTKGVEAGERISLSGIEKLPDEDIRRILRQMQRDRGSEAYGGNTLFQDKLLWVARSYQSRGICYAEISDTTLVKEGAAAEMLRQVHEVMPKVTAETGVVLRFLASIRRIPLTLVRDQVAADDYARENLKVLRAVAGDPYIAGSDIIGEEINDIRELRPLIRELVALARDVEGFVLRIHAGENDTLRDNVLHAVRCVRESLEPGQPMPTMRIGHGLYTPNLSSGKGKQLIRELLEGCVTLEFQITSNVRLNNLSEVASHPLRKYLASGISCVQGTDGGALYGTDSIDEELALEKMLRLTPEELLQMRAAEDRILSAALAAFRKKSEAFRRLSAAVSEAGGVSSYYNKRILEEPAEGLESLLRAEETFPAETALAGAIRELPEGKLPVIVAGGSFNSDSHKTRLRPEALAILDELIGKADPEKIAFVVGSRFTGYEKYLLEKAGGRFEVFSFVPSVVSARERERILASGAAVRVSIEPTAGGTYKSFAYEIFKRRPSVLLALDGNSALANMVQEAKNAKYPCRIFVSGHSRPLLAKARALEGYVTILDGAGDAEKNLEEVIKECSIC